MFFFFVAEMVHTYTADLETVVIAQQMFALTCCYSSPTEIIYYHLFKLMVML